MKNWLYTVAGVAILLLLGCGGTAPKPFIHVEQKPTYNFYPVDEMTPRSVFLQDKDGDRIIHYIDQLIANQQLNDALYLSNDYLLFYPDTPYKEYLDLMKLKIQFLQNMLTQRGTITTKRTMDVEPRTHFQYEGLSQSLGAFLTEMGFQPPGKYEQVPFSQTGYPTKDNFEYFMSLIKETHPRIDSLMFADEEQRHVAEMESFSTFLSEFEHELVWLRIWGIIRDKEWDSAITYADSMGRAYPSLAANFHYLKDAIQNREPPPKGKSVQAAKVASLIIPGLGSMYAGDRDEGLVHLFVDAILVGSAAYLLGGNDYKEDRAETYLGGLFIIATVAWHLFSSEVAKEDVRSYNGGLKQQHFNEFIMDLEIEPPGVR